MYGETAIEGTSDFFGMAVGVDSLDEAEQVVSLLGGTVNTGALSTVPFEILDSNCSVLASNMEEDSSSSASAFWRFSLIDSPTESSSEFNCWVVVELQSGSVMYLSMARDLEMLLA